MFEEPDQGRDGADHKLEPGLGRNQGVLQVAGGANK